MGEEPALELCLEDMIGKECIICLSKQHRNFYSVTDVFMKHDEE